VAWVPRDSGPRVNGSFIDFNCAAGAELSNILDLSHDVDATFWLNAAEAAWAAVGGAGKPGRGG
jgi:hypothetical protein